MFGSSSLKRRPISEGKLSCPQLRDWRCTPQSSPRRRQHRRTSRQRRFRRLGTELGHMAFWTVASIRRAIRSSEKLCRAAPSLGRRANPDMAQSKPIRRSIRLARSVASNCSTLAISRPHARNWRHRLQDDGIDEHRTIRCNSRSRSRQSPSALP